MVELLAATTREEEAEKDEAEDEELVHTDPTSLSSEDLQTQLFPPVRDSDSSSSSSSYLVAAAVKIIEP